MADTVYKLTHTGGQIDSAIDNAVRSDAQILTSEQQTQARTNIGAADTGVRGLTATVEATSTASQAYAIGAYFVYNGLLYKCTVAIAQGKTITPGTNCTATTAGAEISTLNRNLAAETARAIAAENAISAVAVIASWDYVNKAKPGYYYCSGTAPNSFTVGISIPNNSNGDYGVQICATFFNNVATLYTRSWNGTTWGAWQAHNAN